MNDKNREADDLPELPDAAELTTAPPKAPAPEAAEIPTLPEEVELVPVEPPAPESATPAADAPPAPPADGDELELVDEPPAPPAPAPDVPLAPLAASAPTPDPLVEGETPPLRELDAAPAHLRTAATVVVIGALLPFVVPEETREGGSVWFSVGGKAVMLLAAWLWSRQVLHNFGPKLEGPFGKLASVNLKPAPKEEPEKKKRRAAKAGAAAPKHPFPTALHLVAILCIVGALALAGFDPRLSKVGPVGFVEAGILGWGAFTYVHIMAYQRWSSFNPLFALMFIAMALAGVASVLAGINAEGLWKVFSMGGGVIVGGGGVLAVYTMVEAMMAAKKEGDRKKAEAIEARKAARKSRR